MNTNVSLGKDYGLCRIMKLLKNFGEWWIVSINSKNLPHNVLFIIIVLLIVVVLSCNTSAQSSLTPSWTQTSGPATGTIENPATSTTFFTTSVPGIYTLMLNVTDTTSPNANAGLDIAIDEDVEVNFDASGSTDNVCISEYIWDFDNLDGYQEDATGITPSFTFSTPGVYDVTLTVRDTAGLFATDTLKVIVSDKTPPSQSLWTPAKNATISTNMPIIVFSTDESADCKWSQTDLDYGDMSGDCTGDGTTSQSCATSGLSEGLETVYIACRDTLLNEDTIISNEHIIYTVDTPPAAVTLNEASNVLATSLDVSWTQSIDSDFVSYKIYMSQTSGASESSDLLGTINNTTTLTHSVTGLIESTMYYFKVYVCDATQCVGSNELGVNTGTTISAVTLASNTTWDLSGSPYIIEGNVIVPSGITLTIDSGVTIKYSGAYTIEVSGSIVSNGTADNKISYTSTTGLNSGATAVSFTTSANLSSSSISYSVMELLSLGISIIPNTAGTITFDHMEIRDNAGGPDFSCGALLSSKGSMSGIATFSINNNVFVTNSTFTNNEGAIGACGNDFTIDGNTFTNNNNSMGNAVAISGNGGGSLENSSFTNESIYMTGTSSVSHCSFTSTTGQNTAIIMYSGTVNYSEITGYSTGIYMGGAAIQCMVGSGGECISNNNIYNNSTSNVSIEFTFNTFNVDNNWWGSTTDFQIIGGGTVITDPILTAPEPTAGPQ